MNHITEIIEKEQLSKFSEILNELAKISNTESSVDSVGRYSSFNDTMNGSTALNPWFTRENIGQALQGLSYMLRPEALQKWLNSYNFSHRTEPKRIGLILAGNIPMVGFHDIFCVAIAGHKPVAKLSSQDKLLLPAV